MSLTPDTPSSVTAEQAQQRADQIAAFTRELAELDRDAVLRLPPDDRARVDAYHAGVFAQLAGRFDVDRNDRQRQLSLGMRIASLAGAITLSAAVVLFFNRIWGLLATPAQVGVLAAAPLAALAGVEFAARREKTLYIASVMALVAMVSFILAMNVQGVIFNMRPSPIALAAWSAFALIVAYTYGLRLLLAGGIAMAMAWICAQVALVAGIDWSVSITRPEPLVPAGALALAVALAPWNQRRAGFAATWRMVGLVAMLVPLIFLSTWGEVFSYCTWPPRTLGRLYDAAGFVLAIGTIWIGVRAGWREVVNIATGFLVVFLYVKCFDWWWLWMPRYLFFLILGALAVAVLVVLGRLRSGSRKV